MSGRRLSAAIKQVQLAFGNFSSLQYFSNNSFLTTVFLWQIFSVCFSIIFSRNCGLDFLCRSISLLCKVRK